MNERKSGVHPGASGYRGDLMTGKRELVFHQVSLFDRGTVCGQQEVGSELKARLDVLFPKTAGVELRFSLL